VTEPANEPTTEPAVESGGQEGQTAPGDDLGATGSPSGTEQQPGTDSAETFPREYVEQLRAENAEARVKANQSDELRLKLMDAAKQLSTAGVIRDPADLPDNPEFWGEDGLPDHEKIREAAEVLVSTKPWLAKARGSAGQGARPEPPAEVTLGGILRGAAR
jgi:hypothetical protein